MTFAIVAASAAHEPEIRACAELAYAPYIPLIGRRPAPMNQDFGAQILAGQVRAAITPNGRLLGYIVFYPDGDVMLLESVAVFPSSAGMGVGGALVAHCEDSAREAGLRAVRLYTNAAMSRNLELYRYLGYAEIGRRSEDGFHRVYFEKPLTPSAD